MCSYSITVSTIEDALKLESKTSADAKVDPKVLRERLNLYRERKPLRLNSRLSVIDLRFKETFA